MQICWLPMRQCGIFFPLRFTRGSLAYLLLKFVSRSYNFRFDFVIMCTSDQIEWGFVARHPPLRRFSRFCFRSSHYYYCKCCAVVGGCHIHSRWEGRRFSTLHANMRVRRSTSHLSLRYFVRWPCVSDTLAVMEPTASHWMKLYTLVTTTGE